MVSFYLGFVRKRWVDSFLCFCNCLQTNVNILLPITPLHLLVSLKRYCSSAGLLTLKTSGRHVAAKYWRDILCENKSKESNVPKQMSENLMQISSQPFHIILFGGKGSIVNFTKTIHKIISQMSLHGWHQYVRGRCSPAKKFAEEEERSLLADAYIFCSVHTSGEIWGSVFCSRTLQQEEPVVKPLRIMDEPALSPQPHQLVNMITGMQDINSIHLWQTAH